MPKSKRSRIVHTSTVQKKPSKEKSASLYAAVQTALALYHHIFVFSVENMRNTYLKDVRQQFADDGRLFYGKTRVMAKALGTTPEDEQAPGLSKLNEFLNGNVGLLLTNREPAQVLEYFEGYMEVDFARAGLVAPRTFTVPKGVVYSRGGEIPAEEDLPLPHSQEITVRKWGMPTKLEKGKVLLEQDYDVCVEGKEMNSHQTALLKLFGVALAEFRVQVLAYWSSSSQDVTVVKQTEEMEE